MSIKLPMTPSGKENRGPAACIAVPQPTGPPRAPQNVLLDPHVMNGTCGCNVCPPACLISEITAFRLYEGWNFNSGSYLFATDTK